MSIFSWLRRQFSGDAGFLVRDGRELRWNPRELPLQLLLALDAEPYHASLARAAVAFDQAVGRSVFFAPSPALPEMVEAFGVAPAAAMRPRATVLVTAGATADLEHGDTALDYDRRTGEIRSCVVTLPPGLDGGMAYNVTLHELGHVLGLAHDEDQTSVMYRRTRRRGQALSRGDAARLRAAYAGRCP